MQDYKSHLSKWLIMPTKLFVKPFWVTQINISVEQDPFRGVNTHVYI